VDDGGVNINAGDWVKHGPVLGSFHDRTRLD